MKLVSWDGNDINDGTNYDAVWGAFAPHGLPAVRANSVDRRGFWPKLSSVSRPGRVLSFTIYVRSGGSSAELTSWFDPEDETAKQLIVEDAAGGNDRYVMAICEGLDEVPFRAGKAYLVTVRVDGDPRWRSTSFAASGWSITATGQTKTVTNSGKDIAFPLLTIVPTSSKSTGFTKKRQIFIRWKIDTAYAKYPIDIVDNSFDTATEISGGDMQADGDDLRVYLYGTEIDRWLARINDPNTKVWCNLDFQPAIEGALATAIAASGSITSIDFSATMSTGQFKDLPSSGLVVIDSECFSYTSRNVQTMKLEGITREVKGTSMASHSAAATIWWLQHDLVIFYGDSSLSAPTVDDNYKPVFSLTASSNTSWAYNEFGEDDGLRTGAWKFVNTTGSSDKYTANQNTNADPWEELGISNDILSVDLSYAHWEVTNPCGITNANFQNGEKRSESSTATWQAQIRSRNELGVITIEDSIAAPSTTGTWESWSDNEVLTSGAITVILRLLRSPGAVGSADQKIEVADVTLTLNSSNAPGFTLGAEESNYLLSCRITNNTTGQAVDITYGMELNESLKLDTDAKTLKYLKDSTNQFQALSLVGGARKYWLYLAPGDNEFQFDDTGTGNVSITFNWEQRDYQ